MDKRLCDECLYALNGQPDNQYIGPDMNIYAVLNRVISGSYRSGYGVCSATFLWACPWT